MLRARTATDRVPIFNLSASHSILVSGVTGANFTASAVALWNHSLSSLSISPLPASSTPPSLSTETLSLPLLPSFSSLLPMMVSLSNHTAGFLSAWWLYDRGVGWGGLCHSFTLLCLFIFPPSPSLSSSASSHSLTSSLFLSVTTTLEEMSFHGRFAAISKMAALPNGQLPQI